MKHLSPCTLGDGRTKIKQGSWHSPFDATDNKATRILSPGMTKRAIYIQFERVTGSGVSAQQNRDMEMVASILGWKGRRCRQRFEPALPRSIGQRGEGGGSRLVAPRLVWDPPVTESGQEELPLPVSLRRTGNQIPPIPSVSSRKDVIAGKLSLLSNKAFEARETFSEWRRSHFVVATNSTSSTAHFLDLLASVVEGIKSIGESYWANGPANGCKASATS
jgi:hypothetical protein